MEYYQARGYVFEVIIQKLLENDGFYKVDSGDVKGRGAYHQIDAYGEYEYPVPYINPIRIFSEVKCYKDKKIGLPYIRNFVGVMKDISECYFVIKKGKQGKRYNDVGCFFSTTEFTIDAQDYAWAHNIFLISFHEDLYINEIMKGIDTFISAYEVEDGTINLSKEELGEITRKYLDSKWQDLSESNSLEEDIGLLNSINSLSLKIGVLDNRYPIILVGKKDWNRRIKINPDSDKIEILKVNRIDYSESSKFILELQNEEISFNLPKNIRQYLISIINQTESGRHICSIDVPLKMKISNNENSNDEIRRILKFDVKLK